MNRADLLRLQLVGAALAAAAKAALDSEARHEWTENETRASWPTPVGTAYASFSHDRLEVTDEQQLIGWLEKSFPSEVVTVKVVRNPDWLKKLLTDLVPAVADGKADAPPGTKPVAGGDYLSLSIKGDPGFKKGLEAVVNAMLAQGVVQSIPDILNQAGALTGAGLQLDKNAE